MYNNNGYAGGPQQNGYAPPPPMPMGNQMGGQMGMGGPMGGQMGGQMGG